MKTLYVGLILFIAVLLHGMVDLLTWLGVSLSNVEQFHALGCSIGIFLIGGIVWEYLKLIEKSKGKLK